jgi:site-specific recombinase XerD
MEDYRMTYMISREKFLSAKEARLLQRVAKRLARQDTENGKTTWVTRFMLIHLALNTGLRVSEIAALKIGDLHFNGTENYLIVQKGKGGKKRSVYLDSGIVAHLKRYSGVKQKWQQPVDDDSPLLSGRGGNHYTTTALHISFKKAIEQANLPQHFSVHCCRHTYATLLLARSKNLRFVQKQLGHSSIAMTSLYADVLPELNQKLAETILK